MADQSKPFTVDSKPAVSYSISAIKKQSTILLLCFNKLSYIFRAYNNLGLSDPLPKR
nr:hypothetical protein [Mucilaginibacter sp. X5P1]